MTFTRSTWSLFASACIAVACGGSDSSGGGAATPTGQTCTTTAQCYPGLDAGSLRGTVTCLTQLQNGYCTHTCTSDADCCAALGECPGGYKEVCAPLENQPQTYCFVSCDASDIGATPDAGTSDPTAYCHRFASPTFTCRSTGGGKNNRQFCGP